MTFTSLIQRMFTRTVKSVDGLETWFKDTTKPNNGYSRWSRSAAQSTLVIRGTILDGSFNALWENAA